MLVITMCSLVPVHGVVVVVHWQEDVMILRGFKTNLRLDAFLVAMLLYSTQLELASCFSFCPTGTHLRLRRAFTFNM